MSQANDDLAMAVFCDFENVALGVRDAQYDKFDIKPVLERLLLKGSIVVKKAYCDWERYKGFKAAMHEANFELIEIPHVRQSGKNSADIRLVVDALDLCYTKAHVDTFVIVSGDSDFSPLVSKLRENAKRVIGVGVKQSTSDLLIANCDEFIYYDDLVRDRESRRGGRRDNREGQNKRSAEEEGKRREDLEERRAKGIEMAVATVEDLLSDRADNERVWASVVKEALKRRNPGFNESYFGFRAFGNLLEEAANRGLLEFGRDERSGAYVSRRIGGAAGAVPAEPALAPVAAVVAESPAAAEAPAAAVLPEITVETSAEAPAAEAPAAKPRRRRARTAAAEPAAKPKKPARKTAARPAKSAPVAEAAPAAEPAAAPAPAAEPATEAKPARKPRPRRKPKAAAE